MNYFEMIEFCFRWFREKFRNKLYIRPRVMTRPHVVELKNGLKITSTQLKNTFCSSFVLIITADGKEVEHLHEIEDEEFEITTKDGYKVKLQRGCDSDITVFFPEGGYYKSMLRCDGSETVVTPASPVRGDSTVKVVKKDPKGKVIEIINITNSNPFGEIFFTKEQEEALWKKLEEEFEAEKKAEISKKA